MNGINGWDSCVEFKDVRSWFSDNFGSIYDSSVYASDCGSVIKVGNADPVPKSDNNCFTFVGVHSASNPSEKMCGQL